MFIKKLTAVKDTGRKNLFSPDNLFALIFIIFVVAFALVLHYFIFAYFTLGVIVVRIGEIIFEMKHDLFDRPFFHYLVLVGIPAQYLWTTYR